jgi:hypothetical protein
MTWSVGARWREGGIPLTEEIAQSALALLLLPLILLLVLADAALHEFDPARPLLQQPLQRVRRRPHPLLEVARRVGVQFLLESRKQLSQAHTSLGRHHLLALAGPLLVVVLVVVVNDPFALLVPLAAARQVAAAGSGDRCVGGEVDGAVALALELGLGVEQAALKHLLPGGPALEPSVQHDAPLLEPRRYTARQPGVARGRWGGRWGAARAAAEEAVLARGEDGTAHAPRLSLSWRLALHHL